MVSATDPLITLDRIALAPVGQSTSHPPQRRWGDHKSGLEVLDEMVLSIRKLLHGDYIAIYLYEADQITFKIGFWEGQPMTRPVHPPRPEDSTYTIARTGQPAY